MTVGLATFIRNARMEQVRIAIDAGSGPGRLRFYDGARPPTGGVATNLLAEMTFSDPAYEVATNGSITAATIAPVVALATAQCTWARVVDSDDTFIMDLDVGTAGADINLNSTSFQIGKQVEITSSILTDGGA